MVCFSPHQRQTGILSDSARYGRMLGVLLRSLGITRPTRTPLPVCDANARTDTSVEPEIALRIGAVRQYIHGHVEEPINLDEMAVAAGVSKFHLVRLFREETGTTPWAYVQDVRIRRAKELLDTGIPLVEVALQSGFYDQSHFTRTFRDVEGETPGRYRKRSKNIQDQPSLHR